MAKQTYQITVSIDAEDPWSAADMVAQFTLWMNETGADVESISVDTPGIPFTDGSAIPTDPHSGGGAIPMPSSSELDEEEADRQRSYPPDDEVTH